MAATFVAMFSLVGFALGAAYVLWESLAFMFATQPLDYFVTMRYLPTTERRRTPPEPTPDQLNELRAD